MATGIIGRALAGAGAATEQVGLEQMKAAVERTHGSAVLRGVGSFGDVFSAKALQAMDEPLLVASTDGVGTKVELAARLGGFRGVGADIVNHCIGDILVQGARPLFFLDYIASSKLDAGNVAEVVTGMAEACAVSDCALLGGETAEMPGVYAPDAFDIQLSIQLLLMAVIGGLGSLHGVIFGAIFVGFLPQAIALLRTHLPDAIAYAPGIEPGVFGLILVLVILFEPQGIYGRWLKLKLYFDLAPLYKNATFKRQKSFAKSERLR